MQSKPKTISEIILSLPSRSKDPIALKRKVKNEWQNISWTQYYEDIQSTFHALKTLGCKAKDRIAIFAGNSYEWALVDLATTALGGVLVPIYANSSSEDLNFILQHSEAKILFCENGSGFTKWNQIRTQCPNIKSVIQISRLKGEKTPALLWTDFIEAGLKLLKDQGAHEFEKSCREAKESDLISIVYTSGTTGQPKGACLAHEQAISEVTEAFPYCGLHSKDIVLNFLPFAHVLGRIEIWGHLFIGHTLAFAENIDHLKKNLQEIRPTVIVAVPRIFEKFYSSIQAMRGGQFFQTELFDWAISVGQRFNTQKYIGQTMSLGLITQFEIAKKMLLRKIQEAFGGQLRFAICGGAPLNREIAEFFHSCGVLILEGYGLTETTGAICVNTPYSFNFGTVGKPIGDVKIKIAEDGEILVRSKKVMREYYKNPSATQAVFHESWFCTGDIGEIQASGAVRITDRKKDLIKTSGGKYISPQRLEQLIKQNPLIAHVLIHGDQRKYVVAIISLDPSALEKMAKEKDWKFNKWQDLIKHPEIVDLIKKTILDTNTHLASFESIKNFRIVNDEFTVDNGSLTASLKVKRKFLEQKYKELLDSLYD